MKWFNNNDLNIKTKQKEMNKQYIISIKIFNLKKNVKISELIQYNELMEIVSYIEYNINRI